MSILRSDNRGDMIIKVIVETPTKLSKEQQNLLKQLDETLKITIQIQTLYLTR